MYIIPKPKEFNREKEGHFSIDKDCPIVISGYSKSDFDSAKCLKEKINEVTGMSMVIEAHADISKLDRYILLLNLSKCLDPYRKYDTGQYKNRIREEGYILEITEQCIVIVSIDDSGLFYGVQTLKQILNNEKSPHLPLVQITDYPDMSIRGVMLDISGNWTPNLKTLKKLVIDLSEYKINHLQLYIEPDAFKSRKHPIISEGVAAITAEELMELGEVCARLHIDFVPNLQSFGHTAGVLKHKEYEHLAEDPEIKQCLSPVVNETFELLSDYYSEFLPIFHSRFFNVGCDETFDIRTGNGKSAELSKEIGTAGVYFGYIEKIRKLAMDYGKEIMIWADEITHKEEKEYVEKTLQLPKDVVLINWWYDPEWDYETKEKLLEKTNCRHMFCPGTSSWLRFYPEYFRAKQNIRDFSIAAKHNNTMGMLMSDWGGSGHINLLGLSYYGFLYAANTAWNTEADDDTYFDKAYCLNFLGDAENSFSMINNLLSTTYETARMDHEFRNVLFEICFFDGLMPEDYGDKQDPGLVKWGPIDRSRRPSDYTNPERMNQVEKLLEEALMIYKNIRKEDWKQKLLYKEIGFTIKQMMFTCKKYFVIQRLKSKGYDVQSMKSDLELLLEENSQLQEMFSEMWLDTAHYEGLNVHMSRFDRISKNIRSVLRNL